MIVCSLQDMLSMNRTHMDQVMPSWSPQGKICTCGRNTGKDSNVGMLLH